MPVYEPTTGHPTASHRPQGVRRPLRSRWDPAGRRVRPLGVLLVSASLLCLSSCGGDGTSSPGTGSAPTAVTLSSGVNTLTFPASGSTFGLQVRSSTSGVLSASSAAPVTIYVCQGTALDGSTHAGTCPAGSQSADPTAANTVSVPYSSVIQTSAAQVTATATATSAGGSAYQVSDVYAPTGTGMFTMTRTVSVTAAGSGDTGFNSQFSLGLDGAPLAASSYHFMAPAVLYDHNALAPSGAIASKLADPTSAWAYWRETRSGLPMLMMQDPASGTVLSVSRTGPAANGGLVVRSGAQEGSANWLVDPSIAYGSLGVQKVAVSGQANPQPRVGVVYPAVEGDLTYVAGGGAGWSRRSHPVYQGFSDTYAVTFGLDRYADATGAGDYPAAFEQTFRKYYNLMPPAIAADNAPAFYAAGIGLSKQLFSQQGNGNGKLYPGLPFKEDVSGANVAYSYEMGFTGAQIPIGFQLLRTGVASGDATALANGVAILDFWANQDPPAMAAYGSNNLPLTWFEPNHATQVQWSNLGCAVTATSSQRPIFMRELTDGMESMVRAAVFARQTPSVGARRNWEAFADQFGSWLLAHQDTSGTATNGSFQRWFDPTTGQPCPSGINNYVQSLNATTFPIRYLVQMYFATGDARYATAARAAGAYALTNIFKPMAFTGGILINVQDREAGAQALHAALALYDLEYAQNPNGTAAAQWLQQAKIAADYLETWQYSFNIQITDTTANHSYAAYAYAGTRSTSLSNLGSSTGDAYLGIESYDFFRLHLLADDANAHYLRFAQQLEYNSVLATQLVSAGQSFGFKYDGFQTEAITLAGINFTSGVPLAWLSWLTGNQLDPQQQLQDVFGNQSINVLGTPVTTALQQRNHAVYPAAGSIGWGK